MRFDPKKRRYVDANGRVLTSREVRQEVEDYIHGEQKTVEAKASHLLAGSIGLAAFFSYMKGRVKEWHRVTGAIAYGGKAQLDAERTARIEKAIESEQEFLREFQQVTERSFAATQSIAKKVAASPDIPSGLESVVQKEVARALVTAAPSEAVMVARAAVEEVVADSVGADAARFAANDAVDVVRTADAVSDLMGATIPSRAQMYTDAAYSTYENNVAAREQDAGAIAARRICEDDAASCDDCVQAATEEFLSLGEVSDIGSLQCMNNCRCYYEFNYEGVEPLRIDQTVNTIFNRSEAVQ